MSIDDRLHFWEANRAIAMQGLAKVPVNEDVAILVADTQDSFAKELLEEAASLYPSVDFYGEEKKALNKKMTPTMLLIVPRMAMADLFKENNPGVARRLMTMPPSGTIWVVVIKGEHSLLLATARTPVRAQGSS